MLLQNNIAAAVHEIGDELWHTALPDAIHAEADRTAHHFPATVIGHLGHARLAQLIADDMAARLRAIGDTYIATDGVIYTLAPPTSGRYAAAMSGQPVAVEATFEQTAEYGPRTATVRWSDGTSSEAVCFYPDDPISGGDVVGRTQEQIRSLHFRRDRDWLQS